MVTRLLVRLSGTTLRLALLCFAVLLPLLTESSCPFTEPAKADMTMVLKKDEHYLFNPVPSPDGKRIYYLDDSTGDAYIHNNPVYWATGDLRCLSLEDSSDRLLLSGRFIALALSADGTELALLDSGARYNGETTQIVVVDTGGLHQVDLRVAHPGADWTSYCLSFSASGERVVFNVDTYPYDSIYFYSKALAGDSSVSLILAWPSYSLGFAVFDHDSICADSAATTGFIALNPSNTKWVVFAKQGQLSRYWVLRNRTTGALRYLMPGKTTNPYTDGGGYIDWPAWMPDGQGLLFSAARIYGEGMGSAPTELWLLRDALVDTVSE